MIDVTSTWAVALLLAAVCGAVGGVVYELLIDRLGDAGMLEKRSEVSGGGRTYLDLGFWASVVVGATASVAFLYFMPPETTTVAVADAADKVTRSYDAFKLVPASLIVGSGGVSFMKAMRERLLKIVAQTEQKITADLAQDAQLKVGNALAAVQNDGFAAGAEPAVALAQAKAAVDAVLLAAKRGNG